MGRRPPPAPRIIAIHQPHPTAQTRQELWAVVGPLLAHILAAELRARRARQGPQEKQDAGWSDCSTDIPAQQPPASLLPESKV